METNQSDQSIDEPKAKRSRTETECSTSSKPKVVDPFLSLPSDILAKIIVKLPVAQWASLETLDTHFQSAILIAWRRLRWVNVEREFMIKPEIADDESSLRKTCVESILHKVSERSPFLSSLGGIDLQRDNAELNSGEVQSLTQLEYLQSIRLGDSKLFPDELHGILLESVVEVLESTLSRTHLKELQLFNVQQCKNRATILDRFATSFVNGLEIQSSLKLEKFSFSSRDLSLYIPLHTMDTSRLTDVCLGQAPVEPEQLANLIERASSLLRIELSFLHCPHDECGGPRLGANKKLLTALTSHENLTAIKFDCHKENRNSSNNDTKCLAFAPQFIELLRTIGRRGKLRKLELEQHFVPSDTVDMYDIGMTIGTYIRDLQSIKLQIDDIGDGTVSDIVSSETLEEIHLANAWRHEVTTNVIRKIAQLPRLKRLHLERVSDTDDNALECLADVSTLADLRICCALRTSARMFEKCTDVFASNLQTFMLCGNAMKDEHDEDGLVRFLERAVGLRVLILIGYITDKSLAAVAKSSPPDLEILGVYYWSGKPAIRHLQQIVDRCPKLKRLGGIEDEARSQLQIPKYRKIDDVDVCFWKYDFDDEEYE